MLLKANKQKDINPEMVRYFDMVMDKHVETMITAYEQYVKYKRENGKIAECEKLFDRLFLN